MKSLTNWVAAKYINPNFNNEARITPIYCPSLVLRIINPNVSASIILPMIINGIKGPSAAGSCPVKKAKKGVRTPTPTANDIPHINAVKNKIIFITEPTISWLIPGMFLPMYWKIIAIARKIEDIISLFRVLFIKSPLYKIFVGK